MLVYLQQTILNQRPHQTNIPQVWYFSYNFKNISPSTNLLYFLYRLPTYTASTTAPDGFHTTKN